jgi:hypothetical protein
MQVALEGLANGADYTLVVQSTETLPAGKRPVQAELEFDKDGKGVQNLIVTVTIIPAIQITPAPILVKFDPGKDETTIPVTLKSTKGTPFTITSVESKVCTIRDVALPKEPAVEQSISITFERSGGRTSRGFLTFAFGGDFGTQTVYAVFQRELGAGALAPVVQPGAK